MKKVNDMLHNLFVDIGHTKIVYKIYCMYQKLFNFPIFSSLLIIYVTGKNRYLSFQLSLVHIYSSWLVYRHEFP